jgi:hypothetical protein
MQEFAGSTADDVDIQREHKRQGVVEQAKQKGHPTRSFAVGLLQIACCCLTRWLLLDCITGQLLASFLLRYQST